MASELERRRKREGLVQLGVELVLLGMFALAMAAAAAEDAYDRATNRSRELEQQLMNIEPAPTWAGASPPPRSTPPEMTR